MSLLWFTPRRVEGSVQDAIDSLRGLGVRFEASSRSVVYQVENDCGHEVLMKSIGWVRVLDGGEVVCVFRDGVRKAEIRVMLGSAERAVLGDDVRSKRDAWFRSALDGRRGWWSSVQIEVGPGDDATAARILADRTRSAEQRVEAVSVLLVRAEQVESPGAGL